MSPFKDVPGVDVVAMNTLTKTMTLFDSNSHLVTEYEYEADEGCNVAHCHWEHCNLEDVFRNENRTALQCLQACCEVLRELMADNQTCFAGFHLPTLYEDCLYWEEANFSVEEI